jgi:Mn2+/Fe2+ NRAMP family transporter
MPHNLYLHSNIVRFRANINADSSEFGEIQELPPSSPSMSSSQSDLFVTEDYYLDDIPQPVKRKETIPTTLLYTNLDSAVALCGALLINW